MKIKLSEYTKNVATLLSGTTIAQGLALLFSPVISRLYTPDDFAVLALYMGILKVVQIVATGRYEFALVLPAKNTEAANVQALTLGLTTFTAILSLIIFYPLNKNFGVWLNNEKISKWMFLLPLSVLVVGFNKTMNFWLIRNKSYKKISVAKISGSATAISVKISGAKLFVRETGLILGQFFSDFVQALVFFPSFMKSVRQNKKFVSLHRIKVFAKKYKDFPFFNTLLILSDQLKDSGFVFAISSFFGSNILGLYSFGVRYSRGPVSIITQAFTQVTYKKISDLKNTKKPMIPFIKKLLKQLVLLAIAVFLVFFFGGETIFSFVFGEEWRIAGHYVSILAVFIAANLISAPFADIPLALNKQKEFLIIGTILNSVLLLGLIILALIFRDFEKVLIFISILLAVNNFIILFWYLYIAKEYDKSLE